MTLFALVVEAFRAVSPQQGALSHREQLSFVDSNE
jgi:hypothetical protein